MNSQSVQKIFLVLLTLTVYCKACDYNCLTKSYSLNNDARVTFSAKQVLGINYMTIDLVGYNVKQNDDRSIAVSIHSENAETKYSCEKDWIGEITVSVTSKSGQVSQGSSMYRDNTLYCSWTFAKADSIWPVDQYKNQLNLEFSSDYEIHISIDKESSLVASNTEELPIYQLNFMKCCYKVHGNELYQLFIQQTETSNNFTLQMLKNAGSVEYSQVYLTKSDGSQMYFACYKDNEDITGHLQINDQKWLITRTFFTQSVDPKGIYSWSLPVTIDSFYTTSGSNYETRNVAFNLKIYQEETVVYREDNVNLKSSALTQYSNIFILCSTFLFIRMFNHITNF